MSARRAHRSTGIVTRRDAAELEAVAAVERREIQVGRKPARFAKDHIARPGIGAVGIGAKSADDQVGKAVTIHIARRAHRVAGKVIHRDAAELEAVAAVEAGEVQVPQQNRSLCQRSHSSPRKRTR